MSTFLPKGWSETDIDRETLLDVTVNLIPMGILAFFVVLFLIYTPFPPDPFAYAISHALTIIPFVFLGLLTYLSAKVISRDEGKTQQRTDMAMGIETESEHREIEAGDSSAVEQAEREAVEENGETDGNEPEERSVRDAGNGAADGAERDITDERTEPTETPADGTSDERRDDTTDERRDDTTDERRDDTTDERRDDA